MFELSFSVIFPFFLVPNMVSLFRFWLNETVSFDFYYSWTHIFTKWNGSKVFSVNFCHGVCARIPVAMNERNIEVVVMKAPRIRINNKSNERYYEWIYNAITDQTFQSSIIRWMFDVWAHHFYAIIIMSVITRAGKTFIFITLYIIVVIILNPVFRIFFCGWFMWMRVAKVCWKW